MRNSENQIMKGHILLNDESPTELSKDKNLMLNSKSRLRWTITWLTWSKIWTTWFNGPSFLLHSIGEFKTAISISKNLDSFLWKGYVCWSVTFGKNDKINLVKYGSYHMAHIIWIIIFKSQKMDESKNFSFFIIQHDSKIRDTGNRFKIDSGFSCNFGRHKSECACIHEILSLLFKIWFPHTKIL